MPKKRPYASLQDWMERTGHTQRQLLDLVKQRFPEAEMSESHLSNILKGARRCSIVKAFALSAVTGVSVEKLTSWNMSGDQQTSRSVA